MSRSTALEAGIHERPYSDEQKEVQSEVERVHQGRTQRLHLTLSPRSMNRLDMLKEKTEAPSYAEVLKDALRLYDDVIDQVEKGNIFLIRRPNGEVVEYRIFL